MDLFDAVLRPWTVVGCIVGLLLAAGLRWLVPEVPGPALALVVAVGALVGATLDYSTRGRR